MSVDQHTILDAPARRKLGKYELIEQIGVGGMAEVHLARMNGPMGFQKVVVVKTIHPNLTSQEGFLEMLLDEARVSALIKHPRVVDIYDLGHVAGQYFIAMEYLDGQPLSQIMGAGAKGRPLDIYSTVRIIADAAEGLHAAHELKSMSGKRLELVHRDVSPGNIIVLYDGRVKLVDFGVAKARGRLSQSGVSQLKGKLGYMAPEQLANQNVDRRSEIFSRGVVMWEALALTRLFPPESAPVDEASRQVALLGLEPPSRLRREVPDALDAICLRALAPDPNNRFQTAEEMQLAIEGVLNETGYRRDDGLIARYTRATFSRRRRRRSQLLKRLGTASGEYYINGEGDADAETDGETSTAASTVNETRRGTRWGLAMFALVLVAAAAAAVLYLSGDLPWLSEPDNTVAAGERPQPPAKSDRQTRPGGGEIGDSPKVRAPTGDDTTDGAKAGGDDKTGDDTTDEAKAGDGDATDEAKAGDGDATDEAKTGDDDKTGDDKTGDDKTGDDKTGDDKPDDEEKPDARKLYAEGADLFVRGKLGAAKRRFKEAIRANRRHAPAYRGLGLIYQATGRKGAAIRSFKRYLRLRPNAGDAPKIRARLTALEN